MTFASVRAAAQEAAKRGSLTPHQLAALQALDESLTDQQRQQFTDAWRAQGSPAAAADPAWLAPALRIIREFEGLRLEAYRDPVGIWTVGYGLTRLNGGPVRQGDTITTVDAESLLRRELLDLFGPGLFALLPMASRWRPEQQAALLSWAFNVGLGAVEDSTLRKRLLAGVDPATVIREELPRWNRGDGDVLPGLVRRRAAEVALFTGGQPPAGPPRLVLTRTRQRDARGLESLNLAYIKPGAAVASLQVVSGAPGRQSFRTGAASKSGSLEPLPEGLYRVEDIAWATGRDNYAGSWGPGLGPASVPLTWQGPGRTERSAIEIHYDANHGVSPGTAGCVGLQSIADLRTLVGWLRDTDPRQLYVDWGLGTCPAVRT
jgi:GH24 family phage-related lysozyme (muramidase)